HKFPTIWQMTSSVTALSDSSLSDIFAALFPSASITGAPKASSMRLIKELEDTRRDVYTGAIGWIGPDRTAQFSVAIRTAVIDNTATTATYGVGSGIVWDSESDDEYRECLAKARVLATTSGDQNFQLLETMRWDSNSGYHLLEYHLARLEASAGYFDFGYDRQRIVAQLNEATANATSASLRVRLTVARTGIATVTAQALSLPAKRTVLRLARDPVDIASPFIYHKTTQRSAYTDALRDAGPADDVLLWNEAGEITETSIANVVIRFGRKWVTPPVHCGLLAGTERRHLLDKGTIVEEATTLEQLQSADEIGLINSVRGWYSAELAKR
ncbi:MAG: aminotransferase class IV, partial [Woeseia sp.]